MKTCQALQAVAAFSMVLITSGRTFNNCQFSAIWQRFGDFTGWRSFICICSLSSVPLISQECVCDFGFLNLINKRQTIFFILGKRTTEKDISFMINVGIRMLLITAVLFPITGQIFINTRQVFVQEEKASPVTFTHKIQVPSSPLGYITCDNTFNLTLNEKYVPCCSLLMYFSKSLLHAQWQETFSASGFSIMNKHTTDTERQSLKLRHWFTGCN